MMQKLPADEGASEGEARGMKDPELDMGEVGGAMVFAPLEFPGLLIPSWNESVISFVPRRNSLSALPILRPISGSFLGPKISNATTIMIRIWMGCIPNIKLSFQLNIQIGVLFGGRLPCACGCYYHGVGVLIPTADKAPALK